MREQRVDAGAERRELRRVQRLGRGDAVRRGALRVLKRLQIHLQAGHFEQRQAVLPVSEEIARSALRQVRFCNFEAVVRGAEGSQPRLRLGIAVRREEYAVGLRITAPDAAPQLMELREAEAVGVFNDLADGEGADARHPRQCRGYCGSV